MGAGGDGAVEEEATGFEVGIVVPKLSRAAAAAAEERNDCLARLVRELEDAGLLVDRVRGVPAEFIKPSPSTHLVLDQSAHARERTEHASRPTACCCCQLLHGRRPRISPPAGARRPRPTCSSIGSIRSRTPRIRSSTPEPHPTLRKALAAAAPRPPATMRSKGNGDATFKASGKRKTAAGGVAKPKRAPTPFFVFLAEFRPQYLEEHPEAKGVSIVAKAAGEKWRTMSDEEKAKYGGKKQEVKETKAVNKKESTSSKKAKTDGDEEGEGSDKSKSDVEDDGEEDEE